ncbi:MAG: hypothetical protein E2586_08345 [Novosphingobium sp.]|uniref:AIPR family protein n=1 Tax=Novosphingobium sp. TaxID=1874826 RepID=UPI0012BDCBC4|nr:AIPR family protein [Novosphingobium sp.]MPS68491.1 hypothetical protein [Novosphingobium sp.]
MNPIIKAQLNDFRKSNASVSENDSDGFEVMSIFAVENGLLGENVDPFKIHLKGTEFGVDGISILIQGAVCTDADEAEAALSVGKNHNTAFHFFQSKTSENLDYGDFSKFLDAVYDFFTDLKLLKGEQIEDLVDAREKVFGVATKSSPELFCFYCSTGSGEISDAIGNLIEASKKRLQSLNIFESVKIESIGARDLQQGFRAATNASTATISFPDSVIMPNHPHVDEAYIGYVTAEQILELALGDADSSDVRHINRSVFYDNVRDFDPNSEINKSILSDLEAGDLESFVFKNNGVTVVAKEVTRKRDNFTITDYQIVNGCQTTNILAHAREKAADIMVPLRVIGSRDADFVSKIIVGTNKQNEVRQDQFWALLPFMKDLETYAGAQADDSKILIERRDNQYRDISSERMRITRPSDLMKAAAAMFFYQPHRAARDHRGIRKEFSARIFIEGHSVELYHASALAMYKFDYLVRTSRVDRSKSIFKFYALYALVRKNWKEPNILDAPPKSQSKVHKEILKIIGDNDAFTKHIDLVSASIEKMISGSSAKTREQIRDYIRTDSFIEAFNASFF